MRGLTPREREVLSIMAAPGVAVIPVPDVETEMVLRDLTAQGRVLHRYEWLCDGTHERWTISVQGREALRLVPERLCGVA